MTRSSAIACVTALALLIPANTAAQVRNHSLESAAGVTLIYDAYVHDQPHPTLIINDVKTGAQGTGAVVLWVGPGTIAHFRNVTISK